MPAPPDARRAFKRGVDLVLGGLLLIAALPLILLCAAAVQLADPGTALFRQRREGLGGAAFTIWKIRTMRVGAEEGVHRWISGDPALEREWAEYHRLSADPRVIPRVGRFLRRSSLDELPQLWNVVRGDMSLIGPRPLEPQLVERLDPEHLRRRRSVRPGLTGLWQVSGRSELKIDQLQGVDDRYLREWSLALDLRILCATPRALISRRGAY